MVITKIKIGEATYPARCSSVPRDTQWGGRSVTLVTMAVDYATMQALFPAGQKISWSTLNEYTEAIPQTDENGNVILDDEGQLVYENVTKEREVDQSDWCLCGPIIDNRDGTFTVKMGKELDRELKTERDEISAQLNLLMEGE